jgi:parallel beta-helix repeat protein
MRRAAPAAVLVAAFLAVIAPASADTLISSASFETSLEGWGAWNATASRQAIAVAGSYSARASVKKRVSAYGIGPGTAPVTSTVADAIYTAAAAVRMDKPGREICLRIREWSGASVVGAAETCLLASSTWARFSPLSYVAAGNGRELDFYVWVRSPVRFDSFNVDDATLAVADPVAPAPKPVPAPVAPPSALVASGVQPNSLTLSWTAAADTRVTAYRITQNGGVLGTTIATSYGVSGLACGTTYSFGVSSLDGTGASSTETTAAFATFACPPPPPSCTKWAAPNGSDSAAGTYASPFRTAQKLIESLSAAQTGCLMPGTYVENLRFSVSGQPGLPITLTSDPSGRATVQGRMYVPDTANDITVKGLMIDGRNASSLPSPTVTGDRISFIGNEVTNYNTEICFDLGSTLGYGIAVDVVLDGNRIHNCGALPSTNKDHAVYVESTRNAKIINNVIYDNADRGVQLYPDAQGTLVANNVIDGNGEGILFAGESGVASSSNTVVDNLITNANIRYNVESWWPNGNPIGTGNLVQLNCVWNGKQGNFDGGAGYTEVSNLIVDPLYVNRFAKDFRLAAGSPCAGKGPR